jgi:hypothetical protein
MGSVPEVDTKWMDEMMGSVDAPVDAEIAAIYAELRDEDEIGPP